MFIEVFWILAAGLLAFSFLKNSMKTKDALGFFWKLFRGVAIPVLVTVWAIGLLLAFLTPYIVAWIIGPKAEENIQGRLI